MLNGSMGLFDSPYVRLMRLHQPTGIYLLLWPSLWGIALGAEGFPSPWLMLLFSAGAVIMRGAGCVINDLWDRDLDDKVERTRLRPLASGEITPRQAMVFLGCLLLVGMLILSLLPALTVGLGVVAMVLVALYPLMKRITWWPQLFLGFTFNMGVLMGYSAQSGALTFSACMLYAASILWTLGYDTIYALQDKADDAVVGIKSTALRFGAHVKPAVGAIYSGCALLLCASIAGNGGMAAWAGALGFIAHLAWQINRLEPDNTASAHALFKSNRIAGIILFLGLIIDRLI